MDLLQEHGFPRDEYCAGEAQDGHETEITLEGFSLRCRKSRESMGV